jgi:hypothetical protein
VGFREVQVWLRYEVVDLLGTFDGRLMAGTCWLE